MRAGFWTQSISFLFEIVFFFASVKAMSWILLTVSSPMTPLDPQPGSKCCNEQNCSEYEENSNLFIEMETKVPLCVGKTNVAHAE